MNTCDTIKAYTQELLNSQLCITPINELLPPKMITETSGIIKEYGLFICALIECRNIAEKEYSFIENQMHNVRSQCEITDEINNKLNEMKETDCEKNNEKYENALAQMKVLASVFTKDFNASVTTLNKKVIELKENLSYFKVILYGPTKAGKSTVREALTRGDGTTIGRGGQSTTLEINSYNWYNLKLYDTPGILSSQDIVGKGDSMGEEEKKANEILEQADVPIFMFPTDNIHVEALKNLKETVTSGREVLVLLNVKEDMMNYPMFVKRNQNKDKISIDSQEGHVNRIFESIPKEHHDSVKIIAIHAHAGFLSRAKNNLIVDEFFEKYNPSRKELNKISHFNDIRSYLVSNIINRGRVIRCTTLRKCFIDTMAKLTEKNKGVLVKTKITLADLESTLLKAKANLARKGQKLENDLNMLIRNEISTKINTTTFASDAIDFKKSKRTIEEEWTSQIDLLKNIPNDILDGFIKEIQSEFKELENKMQFIWDTNKFDDIEECGNDNKSIFKRLGIITSIAGSCLYFVNPVFGFIASGVGIVIGWLSGLFSSTETKKRKMKESFDEKIDEIASKMHDNILEYSQNNILNEANNLLDEIISSNEKKKNLLSEFENVNKKLFDLVDENNKLFEIRIKELQKGSNYAI